MKKIVIICLLVVATLILVYKQSERKVLADMPMDTLMVFSQEGCPHCHHALAYIDEQIRPYYPDLKIEILDVNKDQKNRAKFFVLADSYHIPDNQLGTPLIVYGDKHIMGWSVSKGDELKGWLKK